MTRRTQQQLVLELLSDSGWHSTLEFIDEGLLRVAAQVFELRCRGFPIEGRRRPNSRVFEYRLVESSTAIDELERIRRKFPDLGCSA